MTRRKARTARHARLDHESSMAMQRAAWHGMDDPLVWERDFPGVDVRAWLGEVYRTNRTRFVRRFEEREEAGANRLAAWPVSEFDPDPGLRMRAQAMLVVADARWRDDPRRLIDE